MPGGTSMKRLIGPACVGAAFLALAVVSAAGDDDKKVNVFEGFEFPRRKEMPKKVQKREWVRFEQKGEKPYKVWMAVEGFRPLKGPRPDADEVPGLRLKWMQPCFVF